jgi:hypothetical protein
MAAGAEETGKCHTGINEGTGQMGGAKHLARLFFKTLNSTVFPRFQNPLQASSRQIRKSFLAGKAALHGKLHPSPLGWANGLKLGMEIRPEPAEPSEWMAARQVGKAPGEYNPIGPHNSPKVRPPPVSAAWVHAHGMEA